MSFYPSLEDMKVDNMMRAQISQHQAPPSYVAPQLCATPSAPSATHVYPTLGEYMGMELSQAVIALNMPEYQIQQVQPTSSNVVAPLSSQSLSLPKATVTQAIRQVVLCKDRNGKCGLRLHSVDSGVFVCYVAANSPGALAGLRFGDQILEINNVTVAGMTMDKCHDILKKAPANNITMAVRDRPFERNVTLHKDSLGHVGFQFKNGKIIALVVDSSAARNGLLTDHQILEINTINVVGMKDKEISKIIDESPSVVNITIIPYGIYERMINKMSSSLFKELDRTPAA
ncbi:syndecan binding protein [Bombyx mori]|uniref:Syndecan binding protein n=1 Tax=Bombyx mori TaxID=7091 RepID=Q1HQB3_BOMMO|nr:syndecan binding protein [Bombyx mori]ABF51228.1 syndecan binding protein [Bombyx mori]